MTSSPNSYHYHRVSGAAKAISDFDRLFSGRKNQGGGNPARGSAQGLAQSDLGSLRQSTTSYEPLRRYAEGSSHEDPYHYQSRNTPRQRDYYHGGGNDHGSKRDSENVYSYSQQKSGTASPSHGLKKQVFSSLSSSTIPQSSYESKKSSRTSSASHYKSKGYHEESRHYHPR